MRWFQPWPLFPRSSPSSCAASQTAPHVWKLKISPTTCARSGATVRTPWNGVSGPIRRAESNRGLHLPVAPLVPMLQVKPLPVIDPESIEKGGGPMEKIQVVDVIHVMRLYLLNIHMIKSFPWLIMYLMRLKVWPWYKQVRHYTIVVFSFAEALRILADKQQAPQQVWNSIRVLSYELTMRFMLRMFNSKVDPSLSFSFIYNWAVII